MTEPQNQTAETARYFAGLLRKTARSWRWWRGDVERAILLDCADLLEESAEVKND